MFYYFLGWRGVEENCIDDVSVPVLKINEEDAAVMKISEEKEFSETDPFGYGVAPNDNKLQRTEMQFPEGVPVAHFLIKMILGMTPKIMR